MKLKINIPTSLSDITLGQYKKYDQIVLTNQGDDYSERFVNLKMLEIFCNISYQDAKSLRLSDFEEIVEQLRNILQEQPKLVTIFKMGDSEFGFIPDLEEMTFGEYIDLDTHIHDMSNIEKAMAVLYRPIKHKKGDRYTIDEYKGDLFHEAMLNMPMSAVLGSIVFFYNLGIDLSNVMMNYLAEGEKQDQELRVLEENGVGISPYMPFLTEILRNSRM